MRSVFIMCVFFAFFLFFLFVADTSIYMKGKKKKDGLSHNDRTNLSHLLQAKHSFWRGSFSSALAPRGAGNFRLLSPGSSSVDLSSSGILNMRGLAEMACSRRGLNRGGVVCGGGMLEQLRHSHSPLGRSLGSTGGSLNEGS